MSHSNAIEGADLNRRESHRMPALEERSEGRLRVGRKWFPCEILDMSTGGFLISVAGNIPRAAADEILAFQTDGAHYPVRLAWHSREGKETRIGLQRLHEDFQTRRRPELLLWFVAAIIVGFGFGYVYANRPAGLNPHVTQILDLADESADESAITAVANPE